MDFDLTVLPIELRAQIAENVIRKDFTQSELAAVQETVIAYLSKQQKANQGHRTDLEEATCTEIAVQVEKPSRRTNTTEKVAKMFGESERTVRKRLDVVAAADAEPEKYRPLVDQMNKTGKVDEAYRKLKAKQDEAQIIATPALTGKYRTIVVDPPWDHEGLSIAGRGAPEYAVMSQEELLSLPVAEWAEENCHLYLWTTNNFLTHAAALVKAWGFAYKTVLTWVKPRIGLGSYFRSSTEHVLFAVRGEMMTRARDIPTHFAAPLGKHSEKPQEFFDLVERASYGPYLEAFARKQRQGWEVWGNLGNSDEAKLPA